MNALTTTNARSLAKTASALTTPALWRRLTDERLPFEDACAELAKDERTMAELRTVGRQLIAAAQPCGGEAVVAALAPLLALYGIPKKTEAEAEAFWGFYLDVLGDVPAEVLSAAVTEYVANPKSEFFPKPGPLKAICDRLAQPLRMAASRARKAMELAK